MVSIETKFCQDIDNYQDAACQADGQARDVNEGIAFISFNPAEGYFHVVPDQLRHETRRLPGRPSAKTARMSFVEFFPNAFWLTEALGCLSERFFFINSELHLIIDFIPQMGF